MPLRLRTMVVLTAALLLLAPDALAQAEFKLTPSDGAAGDVFGRAVAISGDVALVGADLDDDDGDRTGSAYVFRRDGAGWTEEQKLTASDADDADFLGFSVAVEGDVAVAGAFGNDDDGNRSGSAYVFRWNGAEWVEEQKLLASDAAAEDYFGWSVAVDGDVVVVGAPDDDDGDQIGGAYVFRWNGSAWTEEQKLTAADDILGSEFGRSVSVSGDVALVGAPRNDENGDASGSAYVFRWNGTEWTEERKLTASDGFAEDLFGWSVAVAGDIALVGSLFGEADRSGSAYVFQWDGAEWGEEQELVASDGAFGDRFGWSVAVAGGVALVGARTDDDDGDASGSAYVFQRDGAGWVEAQKLTATDAAEGDEFGWAVAVTDAAALVSASDDDDNGDRSGGAYVYDLTSIVAAEPGAVPSDVGLDLDGPNPFRTSTAVALTLEHPQAVHIEVFDVLGRRAGVVFEGRLGAGEHRVPVSGAALTPGLYVVRVLGETAAQTLRLVRSD